VENRVLVIYDCQRQDCASAIVVNDIRYLLQTLLLDSCVGMGTTETRWIPWEWK